MKRIDILNKDDIEREALNEVTFQILRNQSYIIEINDISVQDYTHTYELIELAPLLFQNIRKMFKISNGAIKKIFSLKNLKKLEISVTQGKGGSFFIRPAHGHGKVLLKSVTIPEYNIIKGFLPEYYSHLLMNPNSYMVPILGAYKMKLQKSKDVAPIAFILMRDALDISRYELGPYDRMFTFDLKGSLHNRQVLSNPKDIFEIDANYEDYKDLVFKDIDFIKSFTKLDITNIQADRIMSQLRSDVNLLRENNIMDYSILMYIIVRPYTSVKAPVSYVDSREKALFQRALDEIADVDEEDEDDEEEERIVFNQKVPSSSKSSNAVKIEHSHSRRTHSPGEKKMSPTYYNRTTGKNETLNLYKGEEESSCFPENTPRAGKQTLTPLKDLAYYENKKRETMLSGDLSTGSPNPKIQSKSTLYISESHIENLAPERENYQSEMLSPSYDGTLLVLKEKVRRKLRVFHICENSDINTLKGIEKTEQLRSHDIESELKYNDQEEDSIYLNEYTEKEPQGDEIYTADSKEEEKIHIIGKEGGSNLAIQIPSPKTSSSEEEKGEGSNTSSVLKPPNPMNPNKTPYYRISSVINFDKRTKQLQADKDITGVLSDLSDSRLDENPKRKEMVEKKLQEIDKKIQCEFCNINFRQNHILEVEGIFEDEPPSLAHEEEDMWRGIVQREKIEQLIFDPQLGMVKREIHFGIIDYTTTFGLKKRLEEKLKMMFQKQPSAVNPDAYSKRFLDFAKSIFK